MKKTYCIFAWLACVCFLTASLYAQSTASVVGTVRDSSGAVVPGASITATNQNNGITRTVVSDAEGAYKIVSIPIGPNTFTAAMKCYKQSKVSDVTLQVAQRALVDIALSLVTSRRL